MKKIMFNDKYGLTEAVLNGTKTVTRRELKNQKGNLFGTITFTKKASDTVYVRADFDNGISEDCPYAIGEVIAIAQCYGSLVTFNSDREYPEIMTKINKAHYLCCEHIGHLKEVAGWSNKMFVKADLMPHQIRITDIRAERLQDITEEDCPKEGIVKSSSVGRCYGSNYHIGGDYKNRKIYSPYWKEAFETLIDKISGKGTWESNHFVWRIEFELVK